MPSIPRDTSLDSTLALARDPYGFISRGCQRHRSDLFETRLLLHRTICMRGKEAAELVYDENRFMRGGALPGRVQKTLFGQGGVQGLDDEAHRHRKQMFMSLMTPQHIEQLAKVADEEWRSHARKWMAMEQIVLFDELRELLCRAVCAWAGVPLEESEVGRRTRELTALFDQAISLGPQYWRARLARKRANGWIERLIESIRAGRLQPPGESAAYVIARHRDLKGQLLAPHVAAVELLNVLRPTVAVAVFITFIAVTLHEHPECREKLRADEGEYAEWFVQEVRRFYPFFPFIGARVRHDFEWKGYFFPKGIRVLLDLYGTDHDARSWERPEEFRPERFGQWEPNAFNFIPQGGGDHYRNHRCAGEWITVELMKRSLRFLARELTYEVPEQDLRIDYRRLPALPKSRFIMRNVRSASLGHEG